MTDQSNTPGDGLDPEPPEAIAGLLVRLDRGAMGTGVGPLDCREAAAVLRALPTRPKAGSDQ